MGHFNNQTIKSYFDALQKLWNVPLYLVYSTSMIVSCERAYTSMICDALRCSQTPKNDTKLIASSGQMFSLMCLPHKILSC